MREILLLLVVALVAAAIVFGVAVLITGGDRGLGRAEPDDRYRRPPGDRPLTEGDLAEVRFDTTLRGYRMAQVDHTLARVGYDLGYKQELIDALEAEVAALRDGRNDEAELLRERRLAAREPEHAGASRAADAPAPASDSEDAEPDGATTDDGSAAQGQANGVLDSFGQPAQFGAPADDATETVDPAKPDGADEDRDGAHRTFVPPR